eukprot:gene15556-21005_t
MSSLPPIDTSTSLADDIECTKWLSEIRLTQYSETFLANLSKDGRYLSRKRLSQIRQQDLSNMNIINFVHQKALMQHIRLALKHPFNSPIRHGQIKTRVSYSDRVDQQPKLPIAPSGSGEFGEQKTNKSDHSYHLDKKEKTNYPKKGSAHSRRRRSFDTQVWQSISNLRTKTAASEKAAEQLREGIINEPKDPFTHERKHSFTKLRRRKSLGELTDTNFSNLNNFEKGVLYGNMALEYDVMLTSLNDLQNNHLHYFKNLINCEVASLIFLNNRTRELMLYTENTWFRIASGTGIAGYVAETGESLNVPDAYSDHRFNRNLDVKLGFKTRNILCQPLRGHRGGGSIIGVVQMINKIGGNAFDRADEEALATCVGRVADELSTKFSDLMEHLEKFTANATFIGEKGGNFASRLNYSTPTHSSRQGSANPIGDTKDDTENNQKYSLVTAKSKNSARAFK